MKIVRMVFAVVALLCCIAPSYALDAFMAFDVTNQKMYAVVRGASNEQIWAEVTYTQSDTGGFIGTCCIQYPTPNQCVAEAPLSPLDALRDADVPEGVENSITAVISLYSGPDRSERYDEIMLYDTLVAHHNPYSGASYYSYRAETGCEPIMPETIPIGSNFCAWVCHGTYQIPIECESEEYNPDLLEVTVSNGCAPTGEFATHCDDSLCPRLNWNVFGYFKRVFAGCRLYLVMSYCNDDPGCVCIWRSDTYLPVEIMGFSYVAGDGSVTLNWSSASETGQNEYIITRSTLRDGVYQTVYAREGVTGSARHDYNWTDRNVQNGVTYYYKLHVRDADGQHIYNVDGNPVIIEATPRAEAEMAAEYGLSQNFPNPFNSQTSFTFTLPEAGHVTLKVFDLLGREAATVVDKEYENGAYTVNWSANGLPTGVYMYTLTSGEFSQTKKMLYVK